MNASMQINNIICHISTVTPKMFGMHIKIPAIIPDALSKES